MALSAGTRLGPYEVLSLIGAGGMGEVYRARDTRLDRDVAVKILPEAFAADAERVARFQREAKVLASLSHPNIAIIHGLERTDEANALVMELVEGDDLAQRISRGPLSLGDALPIAKQIAEALEAAHEQGVIHRDLKPANIKVRVDGTVKVLDFGLAKALDPTASRPNTVANSPTLSMQATQAGVILGTAAYMSPEQARGTTVDKRADLWALGVVLYEMLTGQRLFEGATVSDTLAYVLTKDPDWNALAANTPSSVRRLLRRCLEKDRKRRLDSAADAGLDIDDALSEGSLDLSSAPAPVAAQRWSRFGWMAAAGAAGVALTLTPLAVTHLRERPPTAPEAIRFQLAMPENVSETRVGGFALSPDGRYVAFPATDATGVTRVWIRALNSLEARALPGTDGGIGGPPFWSPDSRSLAFDTGGTLKRIDIAGGPTQTVCDVPGPVVGGSWGRDGVILFGVNAGPVMRVSAAGGAATPLTALDASRQENTHGFPAFLPDGRHFLYLRLSTGDTSGAYVGSLDAKPNEQSAKRVVATPFESAYIPPRDSGPGHLLFRRDSTLLAQPFDQRTLELVGAPVPVAERLGSFLALGSFSASATGVLVYRTGDAATSHLTWFDRSGTTHGTVGDPGEVLSVALSPDGTHAAVSRGKFFGPSIDLWLVDFAPGTSTRFTFGRGGAGSPIWSPDGSQLVFWSDGQRNLSQKATNGATNAVPLVTSDNPKIPTGWSRDGRFLLFTAIDSKTKEDVWLLPLDGDRKPNPYLRTEFTEDQAHFSPDGHWIAYRSDESGRSEVYVRAFSPSSPGAKVLVSRGGGSDPRWRSDGKELFYLASGGTLMAVDVTPGPVFTVGPVKPLFKFPASTMRDVALVNIAFWDVAPDGSRFLVPVPVERRAELPFTVVVHWQEELKAKVATK